MKLFFSLGEPLGKRLGNDRIGKVGQQLISLGNDVQAAGKEEKMPIHITAPTITPLLLQMLVLV